MALPQIAPFSFPPKRQIKIDHTERIQKIEILTQQEIKTLYNSIENTYLKLSFEERQAKQYELKLIFALYYGCGLRHSEGYKIEFRDVDFDRKTVFVRQGKNYKDRIVPMNDTICNILKDYIYNYRHRLKLNHNRLFVCAKRTIKNKLKELHTDDEEFQKKFKTLMSVPVYVDSPLAISATGIFRKNMNLFSDEVRKEIRKGDHPLEFPGLQFTQTADESKALNEDHSPGIIISASGMCEVGRIKHHLKHNIWNPNSTILFVGYQAPGTLGYNIVNGAEKVKIFGEEFSVSARIEYIEGYSGHADQEWLMNFIYSFIKKPKHIFLVHGEEESQNVLKEIVEDMGIDVSIPDFGDTYKLGEEVVLTDKLQRRTPRTLKAEVLNRLEILMNQVNDMQSFFKQDLERKDLEAKDYFVMNEQIKGLEKQILKIIEH